LLLAFSSLVAAAQGKNNKVPEAVVSSFNSKYPNVQVKSWKTHDQMYTAKIIMDRKKAFASFDASGNWINTVSKVSWTWDLPKPVNNGFKNSTYRSWNIYDIHQIEKPSGVYYQLTVNNANSTEIAYSAGHFATERQIEFNTEGALTATRDLEYDAIDGH